MPGTSGSLSAGGGISVALLIWCPGLAAIATRLLFQRNLRGFGWPPGKPRYLLLLRSAAGTDRVHLPRRLAYWHRSIFSSRPGRFAERKVGVALNPGVTLVSISFAVTATLVVALGVLTALSEELGGRGLLVPELVRSMSFHRAALISGGIWAAWHFPLIVFADYNAATPAW